MYVSKARLVHRTFFPKNRALPLLISIFEIIYLLEKIAYVYENAILLGK